MAFGWGEALIGEGWALVLVTSSALSGPALGWVGRWVALTCSVLSWQLYLGPIPVAPCNVPGKRTCCAAVTCCTSKRHHPETHLDAVRPRPRAASTTDPTTCNSDGVQSIWPAAADPRPGGLYVPGRHPVHHPLCVLFSCSADAVPGLNYEVEEPRPADTQEPSAADPAADSPTKKQKTEGMTDVQDDGQAGEEKPPDAAAFWSTLSGDDNAGAEDAPGAGTDAGLTAATEEGCSGPPTTGVQKEDDAEAGQGANGVAGEAAAAAEDGMVEGTAVEKVAEGAAGAEEAGEGEGGEGEDGEEEYAYDTDDEAPKPAPGQN